jgi:2-iminobutanoate/2-iminopropanoate deaminase
MTHEEEAKVSATADAGYSEAEKAERNALKLCCDSVGADRGVLSRGKVERRGVQKRAISAPGVLGEATGYQRPSSFSRGLRVDLESGVSHLFLSGTASVGAGGETLYPGNFRAQCWRTYRNLTQLLASESATWHDVVRCTCYLRNIERDYAAFNEIRTEFFEALRLDPLPASTGIQARLCRSDLLVEMEAHAIVRVSSPLE